MTEKFLYEELDTLWKWGSIDNELPKDLTQNLNPFFELRAYQVEAFARFLHCFQKDFPGKSMPLHIMYNMATGSGKTLIMAGLILYLYEKGYRNFLFFVNNLNIIEKTKDNFLNPASIKYLFDNPIVIGNQRVSVTQVDNFEAANPHDINICFTTIQKLHIDLTTEKENAITFEDFRKHKVVLIADEAHHLNVNTKSDLTLFESWENTVERIFNQNEKNLLLEFTATHDYETPAMVQKYRNKVIFRYDLKQFRNDLFSKDVVIVQSDFAQPERILQALILSQYKQEVASRHRINLKPVILLKAQRTIAQSQENKEIFHKLIDNLIASQITAIRRSRVPIVKQAFQFFDDQGISDMQLGERLKYEYQEEFCLSVNEESEKDRHQILLNTLEDKNNRIRANFSVQKLNEGWDVLNLFDIIRCYEARDSGKSKIGKTTMSEAQLIGRGARYFPFITPEHADRFRRKFDKKLEHDLRVLEELHYHSINDSRYIAEINQALVEQGMRDEDVVERQLRLKDAFKTTQFYRFGLIYRNERVAKDYQKVKSFADLGITRRNYEHVIASGMGGTQTVFANGKKQAVLKDENREIRKISQIEKNIIQSAIARNPFFTFASLKRYFPNLTTMQEFIHDEEYLASLEITFEGDVYNLDNNKEEKLKAVLGLLSEIENEIKANVTDYEGTRDFHKDFIHKVFTDKILRLDKYSERGKEDQQFDYLARTRDWFAYNTVYGTDQERAFVRMLDTQISTLEDKYDQIYLLRNEGHFAIYDFEQGRPFEPDFVLFLQEKDGSFLTYQLFIEPKGKYLQPVDRWKEAFLKEIKTEFADKILKFASQPGYRIIGVPFYNVEDENRFKDELMNAISFS